MQCTGGVVDKFHCMTTETAEASEGRNVEHNLDDDFCREPIELTGGKTGGDGHANVSAIVEWAAFFESCIGRG